MNAIKNLSSCIKEYCMAANSLPATEKEAVCSSSLFMNLTPRSVMFTKVIACYGVEPCKGSDMPRST